MTHKEWRAARNKREDRIIDNIVTRARAKRERESQQVIASRPEQKTKSRLMHIAIPSKLKTERVVTAQVEKDRETIQDYITKTDSMWLAAILRQ